MTAVNLQQKRERTAAWKMTPGKFVLYAFMYPFASLCLLPLVWLRDMRVIEPYYDPVTGARKGGSESKDSR